MLLYNFIRSFVAWKATDDKTLSLNLYDAIIAIFNVQLRAVPGKEEPQTMAQLQSQMKRMRAKLEQLGGIEEIRKVDKVCRRLEKEFADLNKGGSGGDDESDGSDEDDDNDVRRDSWFNSLCGPMRNERFAHELLYDPAFQLKDDTYTLVVTDSRKRNALWENLARDLTQSPPVYPPVIISLLKDIRDGISDLTGGAEKENIHEIIDVDFIKTRADNGAFYSWSESRNLIYSVAQIIRRVQYPSRDEDTSKLFKEVKEVMESCSSEAEYSTAFCKGLKFLFDRINIMRVDAANARLRLVSPIVRDQGVDYERRKFRDKLDAGAFTLAKTESWIGNSLTKKAFNAPEDVFIDAMLELVICNCDKHVVDNDLQMIISPPPVNLLTMRRVPETLLMDVDRLRDYNEEMVHNVSFISSLVRVKHIIGEANSVRFSKILAEQPTASIDQAIDAIFNGKVDEEEIKRKVKEAITSSNDKRDSIFKLM